MGVVSPGVTENLDLAAQFSITFFNDIGIFCNGDHSIFCAGGVNQGHTVFGKYFQIVNGVAFVVEGFFFGAEIVVSDKLCPVFGGAFAAPFAARPRFEVAHRIVSIETGGFFRISDSKVVNIKTAPAESQHKGTA